MARIGHQVALGPASATLLVTPVVDLLDIVVFVVKVIEIVVEIVILVFVFIVVAHAIDIEFAAAGTLDTIGAVVWRIVLVVIEHAFRR